MGAYTRADTSRLAQGMPPQELPATQDATWTGGLCWVAIEPVRNSILLAHTAEARPKIPTLRDAERAHIQRVLEAVSWNKKEAARVLEISRGTLYRKILEYQLDQDDRPARVESAV